MVAQPLRFAPRVQHHFIAERDDDAIQEMLQPEPRPEPPQEGPWDAFVARQRARDAIQAARDREIVLGNEQRRVATFNRITGLYEMRNE